MKRRSEPASGLELSEQYYKQIVEPILRKKFPRLSYSAGLIGTGSEVLGYDTRQSTDHNWGLRLLVFLPENDFRKYKPKIDRELRSSLPATFRGYPTSFGKPDEVGVRVPDFATRKAGDINHYVTILTVNSFFNETIGFDPLKTIEAKTWLAVPQQRLLELTSGKLFRDGLHLKRILEKFRYYPKNVWLYVLASQWSKISEEEAFVGRASAVGDEAGSRLIVSKLAKELMELCFLMEKKYAPYSKWFGTAFSNLEISTKLAPVLSKILESDSIRTRETWLSEAYRIVAEKHNSLKITRKIPTGVSRYYDRPYLVIHADSFAKEIKKEIRDQGIRRLPLIGSIDQITDNPTLLNNKSSLKRAHILYES